MVDGCWVLTDPGSAGRRGAAANDDDAVGRGGVDDKAPGVVEIVDPARPRDAPALDLDVCEVDARDARNLRGDGQRPCFGDRGVERLAAFRRRRSLDE